MYPLNKDSRIFIAGHLGMVGSALLRRLQAEGFTNLLTASRDELDLRDQAAVDAWFRTHRPELVVLAAGTVGGILANSSRPAEFIFDNLLIHSTVVHSAYRSGVERLLYLGSACVYPRECPQPITEDSLLSGPLEPTNEPYAIAKIAGIKLCQAYHRQYGSSFISAMPTNLYGPNDNFDLQSSHVLPALMRKFHEARSGGQASVTVWGTGAAVREFLHVDDLADACLFLLGNYDSDSHINVGTGVETSIRDLAEMLREIIAPEVEIVFDRSKPDGMPRRLLDVGRMRELGWKHRIELREGIEETYAWFRESYQEAITPRSRHPRVRDLHIAGDTVPLGRVSRPGR